MVCVNGKKYSVRNLISKLFTDGYKQGDIIKNIDGDIHNCSVDNLMNISKDIRNRKGKYYSIERMSEILNVSTSTIVEVKRKLKINERAYQVDFERIEKLVNDILKSEGKASLCHINSFLKFHNIEDY